MIELNLPEPLLNLITSVFGLGTRPIVTSLVSSSFVMHPWASQWSYSMLQLCSKTSRNV